MSMRSLTEKEKNDLITLYKDVDHFQKELRDIVSRGFAIEEGIEKGSILFISMNPSYRDGAWNNGTKAGNNAIYQIPGLKNAKTPKDTNSFFQVINRFYNELNVNKGITPLAHHDLLFIRETSQETVLNWKKKLDKFNNPFFNDQLNLSKTIIEDSKPKLIVVLNAGARALFEQIFQPLDETLFDDNLGAYLYQIGGKDTPVPVLFSGMLSGQRAIDLGSRRSLRWHIEYILK